MAGYSVSKFAIDYMFTFLHFGLSKMIYFRGNRKLLISLKSYRKLRELFGAIEFFLVNASFKSELLLLQQKDNRYYTMGKKM